jgi:ParB/RepB/Spo0J family partition protein
MATATEPTRDVSAPADELDTDSYQAAINKPAHQALCLFTANLLDKGLAAKPISAWPTAALTAARTLLEGSIARFEHQGWPNDLDRNELVLDIRLLTWALSVRGKPGTGKTKATKVAKSADAAQAELSFAPEADKAAGATEEVLYVPIAEVEPDPEQPRKDADSELAESIRTEGVLQPIIVRPHPDPAKVAAGAKYMIRYGERRYRGAMKAGRPTIPVIVRETDEGEARRLVRQTIENTGKPLSKFEEARAWKRVMELTGCNINQLAKMLSKSKSTVSDRLALVDAPKVFQPLFESGELTAAAAPVLRKFAHVPSPILEKVLKTAQDDWGWEDALRDNKGVVPVEDFERIIEDVLLGQEGALAEVPVELRGEYGGETIDIAGVPYATNRSALEKAAQKWAAAHPEPKTKQAKAKRQEPSADEKRWAEQQKKERERRQQENQQRDRIKQALPALVDAVGAAIKRASVGDVLGILAEWVIDASGADYASEKDKKRVAALVPRGSDAVGVVRHAAMWSLMDSLTNEYNIQHRIDQMTKTLKPLGVDVKKVIEAALPPEPAAKPETKKPAKVKGAKAKKKAAKKKAKR